MLADAKVHAGMARDTRELQMSMDRERERDERK
jgi:hypothetical protein